jgi:hypothetical protein
VSGQGVKGPSNIGRDMVSIDGRVLLLIYTGSLKAVEWRLLELRSSVMRSDIYLNLTKEGIREMRERPRQ